MFGDSVYCVMRRATVRIAWTPLTLHEKRTLPDTPVPVCLDYGEACWRAMRCPTFQVPRAVMAAWIARAGLGHGRLPERRDRCPLCGDAAELQEIDAGTVYCPRCGGISATADPGNGAGGREGATT